MPLNGGAVERAERSAAVGAGADGVDLSRFIVDLPWRTPEASAQKGEELARVDERLPPSGADARPRRAIRRRSPLLRIRVGLGSGSRPSPSPVVQTEQARATRRLQKRSIRATSRTRPIGASFATRRSMEFRILGPVEVVWDGRVVALGPSKQRALLALLLLHVNEVVSRDRLIEDLWGERAPPT